MPNYIDGFVIPLPKDKLDEYLEIARAACKLWMEFGALEYRECIGDDMETKDMVSFPQLAGAKAGETVLFSWITYKSREHRDAVNAKVMADPRLQKMMEEGQAYLTVDAWLMAASRRSSKVDRPDFF